MGPFGSPAVLTHKEKVLTFNAHQVGLSNKESVTNPCSEICQARMDLKKKEVIFSRKKEVIFSRKTGKGVATTQEGGAPTESLLLMEAYRPTSAVDEATEDGDSDSRTIDSDCRIVHKGPSPPGRGVQLVANEVAPPSSGVRLAANLGTPVGSGVQLTALTPDHVFLALKGTRAEGSARLLGSGGISHTAAQAATAADVDVSDVVKSIALLVQEVQGVHGRGYRRGYLRRPVLVLLRGSRKADLGLVRPFYHPNVP
jgi:hypothetical protein